MLLRRLPAGQRKQERHQQHHADHLGDDRVGRDLRPQRMADRNHLRDLMHGRAR